MPADKKPKEESSLVRTMRFMLGVLTPEEKQSQEHLRALDDWQKVRAMNEAEKLRAVLGFQQPQSVQESEYLKDQVLRGNAGEFLPPMTPQERGAAMNAAGLQKARNIIQQNDPSGQYSDEASQLPMVDFADPGQQNTFGYAALLRNKLGLKEADYAHALSKPKGAK